MALTEGKGRVIAPAGHAYIRTRHWLKGASIKECRTADDRLWVCSLNRGTQQAWLVWNTTGSREWAVPANALARRYETLSGEEGRVGQHGRVHVNEAPLLVLSDDEKWGAL